MPRPQGRAGQGERNCGPLNSCSSPPPESGLQPDFQQGNSGHRLRGLWRKRLQKLLQIPAGLETSTPCSALHCQVPPRVFPSLIPSPRDKASAASYPADSGALSLSESPVCQLLTCSTLHQTYLRAFRCFSSACISKNSGNRSRDLYPSPGLASWECLLICKGNPTLPVFQCFPFPWGARRGFGLTLSTSLNHSCLFKFPNHMEQAQQVLGEDDPIQSQAICEGLRAGPPPSHLLSQSVRV